jgi:hypothetical protein
MNKVLVVVKKDFLDRYTGLNHKKGEKLEVTVSRYKEILRSGDYVEILKPETK